MMRRPAVSSSSSSSRKPTQQNAKNRPATTTTNTTNNNNNNNNNNNKNKNTAPTQSKPKSSPNGTTASPPPPPTPPAATPTDENSNQGETETTTTPSGGMLSQIANFMKSKLNPTTTVVRTLPVVNPSPPTPGYGHSNEEEIKEYFDSPEDVEAKVKLLAQMILNSLCVVAYTGAGISTSAKIPDYRGPNGVWTLRDKGLQPKFDISIEQAIPTVCIHIRIRTPNDSYSHILPSLQSLLSLSLCC